MEYRLSNVNSNTLVKYYHADGQRIAMREGSSTLYYFVSDHLGSTALTLKQDGTVHSETRYKPFGDTAWSSASAPTRRRYTGQLQDFDLPQMQLYFYNARYYDPALARFTQADTIVPQPGNPQSLNRYTYVVNNPLKYSDPTGHFSIAEIPGLFGVDSLEELWWWGLDAYIEFQTFLLDPETTFEDILIMNGENGVRYEFLLTQDAEGQLIFYNILDEQIYHPSIFVTAEAWELWSAKEQSSFQHWASSLTPVRSKSGLLGLMGLPTLPNFDLGSPARNEALRIGHNNDWGGIGGDLLNAGAAVTATVASIPLCVSVIGCAAPAAGAVWTFSAGWYIGDHLANGAYWSLYYYIPRQHWTPVPMNSPEYFY